MGPNPADWYPCKKRKLGHMERYRGWTLIETVPGCSEKGHLHAKERDLRRKTLRRETSVLLTL